MKGFMPDVFRRLNYGIKALFFNIEATTLNLYFSLEPKHRLTLVDVGAAGDIEPRWQRVKRDLRYISFEPDCRSQVEAAHANGTDSHVIFNHAVWDRDGEVEINLCRKAQVSSTFAPNRQVLDRFPAAARFDIVAVESVKAQTLDQSLEEPVDFIKIDVQGGALKVLQGAKTTLAQCLGLELEIEFVEMYTGQPLFGRVSQELTEIGFDFIDFVDIVRWERTSHNGMGQVIFCDALFMRSPEWVIENATESQSLAYLKICLLYNRFDLALSVLNNTSNSLRINVEQNMIKISELHNIFNIKLLLMKHIYKFLFKNGYLHRFYSTY